MSEVVLLGTRYISRTSLMQTTGCSAASFREAEAAGLPRIKFGKHIYYPETEVRRWVRDKLQAAA